MSTVLVVIVVIVVAAVALTYSASRTGTGTPVTASTIAPPAAVLVLPADRYDFLRHRAQLQRSRVATAAGPRAGTAAASQAGASLVHAVRYDPTRLQEVLRFLARKKP